MAREERHGVATAVGTLALMVARSRALAMIVVMVMIYCSERVESYASEMLTTTGCDIEATVGTVIMDGAFVDSSRAVALFFLPALAFLP
jgi:glycerol-3-phosphate acyltransferase PlsY